MLRTRYLITNGKSKLLSFMKIQIANACHLATVLSVTIGSPKLSQIYPDSTPKIQVMHGRATFPRNLQICVDCPTSRTQKGSRNRHRSECYPASDSGQVGPNLGAAGAVGAASWRRRGPPTDLRPCAPPRNLGTVISPVPRLVQFDCEDRGHGRRCSRMSLAVNDMPAPAAV